MIKQGWLDGCEDHEMCISITLKNLVASELNAVIIHFKGIVSYALAAS